MFDHDFPYADGVSERLRIAIRHIEFARKYSRSLLDGLSDDDWFWSPEKFTTHIAWQVGHLAMSQYGLTLYQQRGRNLEVDKQLMSSKVRKLFMRGTKPVPERDAYPDEEIGPPHAAFATRYGALLFAADHEMIHSGQIGMLRRLMGKEPLR